MGERAIGWKWICEDEAITREKEIKDLQYAWSSKVGFNHKRVKHIAKRINSWQNESIWNNAAKIDSTALETEGKVIFLHKSALKEWSSEHRKKGRKILWEFQGIHN